MTLLWGHELATALATLAALLAVLTGEQLHPVAWSALAVVPLGGWMRARRWSLPTGMGGALALGAVLFGILFTWTQGLPSLLLGAGYALFLLVCVRLVNRETPAHDLQLYALSLLLVLDAAALNVNWIYAPCFLVYTVAIVWALTTRELKRAAQADHDARHGHGEAPLWHERGLLRGRFFAATAVMAVVVLVGTLALFVVFPRVGLGLLRLGMARKTSGFATSISLGTGGGISADNTVVLRVHALEGEELPLGLYFRGAAFDRYDGTTWSRTRRLETSRWGEAAAMPAPGPSLRRYRVSLEPLGVPYLFTTGRLAHVTVEPGPRILVAPPLPVRDGLGDLVLPAAPDEMLDYEVTADLDTPAPAEALAVPIPDTVKAAYLDVESVSAQAQHLAWTWVGDAQTPVAKVGALVQQLRRFSYSLEDEVPPPGVPVLDHFLFQRRAGHCEYFATALAALSRVVGVPARVVGGYQGGARHRTGYLVVRQSDAHAWVEVYLAGVGWVAVDGTPATALERPGLSLALDLAETLQRLWEDYVIDFDIYTQAKAAGSVRDALTSLRALDLDAVRHPGPAVRAAGTGLGALAGLVLGALAVRRWWPRRRRPGTRLHRALEAAVTRVSGTPARTETVREWVASAQSLVDPVDAATLDGARQAYEQWRFGGQPLDPGEMDHWVERLRAVRRRPEPRRAA